MEIYKWIPHVARFIIAQRLLVCQKGLSYVCLQAKLRSRFIDIAQIHN